MSKNKASCSCVSPECEQRAYGIDEPTVWSRAFSPFEVQTDNLLLVGLHRFLARLTSLAQEVERAPSDERGTSRRRHSRGGAPSPDWAGPARSSSDPPRSTFRHAAFTYVLGGAGSGLLR